VSLRRDFAALVICTCILGFQENPLPPSSSGKCLFTFGRATGVSRAVRPQLDVAYFRALKYDFCNRSGDAIAFGPKAPKGLQQADPRIRKEVLLVILAETDHNSKSTGRKMRPFYIDTALKY